jgi:hypothetical protein
MKITTPEMPWNLVPLESSYVGPYKWRGKWGIFTSNSYLISDKGPLIFLTSCDETWMKMKKQIGDTSPCLKAVTSDAEFVLEGWSSAKASLAKSPVKTITLTNPKTLEVIAKFEELNSVTFSDKDHFNIKFHRVGSTRYEFKNSNGIPQFHYERKELFINDKCDNKHLLHLIASERYIRILITLESASAGGVPQ